MAIREVTMYTVCCDEGGVSSDEGTDYVAWTDAASAEEVATGDVYSDWQRVETPSGVKHFCEEHRLTDDDPTPPTTPSDVR